ncbi:MAG: GGDEF domain-containing protein [Bradyrhizobium sp.]|uniref:GGDEF domain-containing protein n=1 Tax=Bradyrhizobium sp. TaxID=376 RepID=UPI0025BD0F3A|nr:GGDEF domain-containing protein [Bradyrhizobium sp.]MBI5262646.1 GGDEF domain-containing protein [Bradyrhizobium sp.]
MSIQISTHGDVLRHTARRVATAVGLTLLMAGSMLLLHFGPDFDATVRVGHMDVFSLVIAAAISAALTAFLSYRSALLMRELTLTRAELSRISQTDELTGLLNRRGFDDAGASALKAARAMGEPATLFMFDIDHFKSINDRSGHEAGDKVLVEMADVLRRFAAKNGALVSRYGGEEFAALMTGISRDQAERYAEEIRATCAAREVAIGAAVERVTISIGFTVSAGGVELAELMRIADHALYAAKRRGRDRVVQADDRSPVAA